MLVVIPLEIETLVTLFSVFLYFLKSFRKSRHIFTIRRIKQSYLK